MFKFTLKNVLLAILFTLISLVFTAHWFIKSDYWRGNFTLPDYFGYYIDSDSELNIKRFDNNVLDNTSFYLLSDHGNRKKYHLVMMGSGLKENNWAFSVTTREKTNYKALFAPKTVIGSIPVNISLYKMNGNDIKNNQILTLEPNKVYYFNVKAKLSPMESPFFKYINYVSLAITILLEFFAALFLISYGFKNIFSKIVLYVKSNKIPVFLFLFFMAFYLILNLKTAISINYLRFFNAIIGDAPINTLCIMYDLPKRFHPYFFLPFYPAFDFLILLTNNLFLSLCLIFTTLASLSVMFLYKTLSLILPKNNLLTLLITLVFGFSFCQILSSYSMDLYVITGFWLTVLLYLVTKETLNHDKFNWIGILLVAAFSFGVTVPNIITILIILVPLFIKRPKSALIFIVSLIILCAGLLEFKSSTCYGDAWKKFLYNRTNKEVKAWVDFDLKSNLEIFKEKTLYNPLINSYRFPKYIDQAFWIFFIILLIMGTLSKQKDKSMYYSLLGALLYNFTANFLWCPLSGLLFSPNHFAIWFVLMGYSFKFIDKKSVIPVILLMLLIMTEIPINYMNNKEFQINADLNYPFEYNPLEHRRH